MDIKFLTLLLYSILTVNAYAYLDPGTGSLILQLILGGIAAFFAMISGYFTKIKILLKKIFKSKKINSKNN